MTSLTLFTDESLDAVGRRLQASGWQVKVAGLTADKDLLSTDAFLTTNPETCLFIREMALQQAIPEDDWPLCILIADSFVEADAEVADLVLPAEPDYIISQLKTVLGLHTRVLEVKQENLQLQHHLQKQKRASDEVEIIKNAIVRNVSHELKTPLLQVKSAVSLMSEDIENEDLVNYAKNATARLETMVKNITLLGSNLDINPSPVILRDAIEYAKRNLRRAWEHRDDASRIQINIDNNLPPIMADKQGLSTVIQLLIDNALKFSEEDVEVTASVVDGEYVQIAITDYGIGIEEVEQQAIFETFYQIDHSSTRRYGGAGVGLAIVRPYPGSSSGPNTTKE